MQYRKQLDIVDSPREVPKRELWHLCFLRYSSGRRSMDDRSFIAGQAAGSIGLPAFWEASSDSDAHRPRRRRRRPLLVSSMPNANLTTIKSVRDDDDVAAPGPSVSCRNGVGTVQRGLHICIDRQAAQLMLQKSRSLSWVEASWKLSPI